MTGFRNFVVICALAAASAITPVSPVQAMPRATPNIQIKGPSDVQTVQYYNGPFGRAGLYSSFGPGWGPSYYSAWRPGYYPGIRRSYYNGWGPSLYPRRGPYYGSGFGFYFGPSYGRYYPGRYYYGNRYYYGTRLYGPGYYSYRYYRPDYYSNRYVRGGYNAHVAWCLSRYRSYNPATNRFLTYGGVYKACYSPYR
ncbi:BA14K family protein [Ensifer sp. IC3342]|nr:BA14K family protein [Ensifer sp. BRP08]MCA1446188.1 BA14K family protein [Ensifer sp. IC3342]